MDKISIQDIAKVLTDRNGLKPKDAELFVTSMFDVVQKGLERDSLVKIKGFGTFKIIAVDARESVNVNTGERVVIESHGKITFTPEATIKEIVNKPFSQFETVVLNEGVDFDDMADAKAEPSIEREPSTDTEPVDETEEVVEKHSVKAYNSADYDSKLVKESPIEAVEPTEEPELEPLEPVMPIVDVEPEKVSEEPQPIEDEPIKEVQPESKAVEQEVDTVDDTETKDEPEQEEASVPTAEDATAEGEPSVNIKEDDATEDQEDEESPKSNTVKWIVFCCVSLLLILAAGYGGYRYGMSVANVDSSQTSALPPVAKQPVVKKQPAAAKTVDSIAVAKAAAAEQAKLDSVKASARHAREIKEAKELKQAKEKKENADKASANSSSKYDNMDSRVRTGAYRIVGTDHLVTVKDGETVSRISTRSLGEGMSCYVEVYNGLTSDSKLKAGQTIKIPQLELRKKKRR